VVDAKMPSHEVSSEITLTMILLQLFLLQKKQASTRVEAAVCRILH